MKLVAVTTVRDPGAAEVLREALSAHDVPVELKRLGVNPYFGSLGVEIEVRVPPSRLDEARAILQRLEEEAEAAAVSQAVGHPPAGAPADAAAEEAEEAPAPPRNARAFFVGVAAVLVAAFGLFYLFHTLY